MPYTAKIQHHGKAAIISIPPELLKMLGVEVGATLTLLVDNGSLIATPQPRKRRYTIDELLEGADELISLNKQAAGWETAGTVGNEA